jgi:rubrerythrin
MNFESIHKLLLFAISKEQASRQFYLDVAGRMKEAVSRRMFEVIAEQEARHEESLKLEVLKQGFVLGEKDSIADAIPEFDWKERLEMDADAAEMNYADVLMVAIQKERAAFQMYTQLISMTETPELRRMLLELAEEEMRHVIQFEREYDAVSH